MIRLYMDVHVRREVTVGLRMRGVDVLTAQEDGAATLPDAELLTRATELGRVLFSQDTDFEQNKIPAQVRLVAMNRGRRTELQRLLPA